MNANKYARISLLLSVLLLVSCAGRPPIPDNVGKPFSLETDLIGKTVATGSFSAIDGTHRDFITYIEGTLDGSTVTLVEDFEFDDGVKERKTWVLTKLPNGEYSGIREDVIGTARGYQDGDAFRLEYTMAIPDENGEPGRAMKFRDVLANNPEGAVVNKATVGLWGFQVATVDLLIKRPETEK